MNALCLNDLVMQLRTRVGAMSAGPVAMDLPGVAMCLETVLNPDATVTSMKVPAGWTFQMLPGPTSASNVRKTQTEAKQAMPTEAENGSAVMVVVAVSTTLILVALVTATIFLVRKAKKEPRTNQPYSSPSLDRAVVVGVAAPGQGGQGGQGGEALKQTA